MPTKRTDKEILDWILARVTYLEHKSKDGLPAWKNPRGCYWPQNKTSTPDSVIEECMDLPLYEYLELMMLNDETGVK